jgi:chemotaxis protein MotA
LFAIIGAIVVIASVIGGYMAMGGHVEVLFQPFKLVIIGGSALGAFIIANPKVVVLKAFGSFGTLLRGSRYNKAAYLEFLGLLYTVFRILRTKGPKEIEEHVEDPDASDLYERFPKFKKDKYAVTFLCDYLRMVTLGTNNPHELEDLMEHEIETHEHEQQHVVHAVHNVAEGLPALGIVAAVLGVIHTMGSISEPPEILGGLIAGALVGTFLGILLSYGFVGPVAASPKSTYETEAKYLYAIKAGLLAHVQGYAPAISVEFSRKSLLSEVRPTFVEVEEACSEATSSA